MKKTLTLVAAFALLFAVGCCSTTTTCPPSLARTGMGVTGTYRLGGGATANSQAVRLVDSSLGCRPAPCATGCPGSGRVVAVRKVECAPLPPPPPCGGAQPPARPVAMAAPAPAPVVATGCGLPGGACPPSPFDSVVCAPADNLGNCITLPERESVPQVEIYVPNGGVLEKLSDIPAATGPYADALNGTWNAAKDEPPAAAEAADAKAQTPAVPPETASGAAETADKGAAAEPKEEGDMPPMFREGMTDKAAEEVLSRAGRQGDAEGLQRVELPPEL